LNYYDDEKKLISTQKAFGENYDKLWISWICTECTYN